MIGLMRVTDCGTDQKIYINPSYINLICPSSPEILMGLNFRCEFYEGATLILLGGIGFQVKETLNEVTGILSGLRKKIENAAIDAKKRSEKSEWDYMDEGYDEDSD